MTQIHTAGLLILSNSKLLLTYSSNKQCFYLPGGKVDAGKTTTEALCRGIQEKLKNVLLETGLVFNNHIAATAYR
jgi:ADP-ribose pyrophosphatase YjhB (NUDIX family)